MLTPYRKKKKKLMWGVSLCAINCPLVLSWRLVSLDLILDSGEFSNGTNCFTSELKKKKKKKKNETSVTGLSCRKCPSAEKEERMNKRWPCTAGSSLLLKWVSRSRNIEAKSICVPARMCRPVIYCSCHTQQPQEFYITYIEKNIME